MDWEMLKAWNRFIVRMVVYSLSLLFSYRVWQQGPPDITLQSTLQVAWDAMTAAIGALLGLLSIVLVATLLTAVVRGLADKHEYPFKKVGVGRRTWTEDDRVDDNARCVHCGLDDDSNDGKVHCYAEDLVLFSFVLSTRSYGQTYECTQCGEASPEEYVARRDKHESATIREGSLGELEGSNGKAETVNGPADDRCEEKFSADAVGGTPTQRK
ncbi:hypothetical protein RYH80_18560 [Halobaculum sp. MBLA0147]|uniref:hypothetical protein n=1 Tax=Halobaculum sp. MBLA0147 TaxID=3079934 RepID=UPI0035269028